MAEKEELSIPDKKEEERDENSTEMNCELHPEETIRLFCTECDDPVCLKCLLEKHQQHPLKSILEGLPYIKEKVKEWCSVNKEETKQKLRKLWQDIKSKIDKSIALETEAEENIRRSKIAWKNKIEEEGESMSSSVKSAFGDSREPLCSLICVIENCEKEIENLNSLSESKYLSTYCNIKTCMDKERNFGSNIDPEYLCFLGNSPTENFSIGYLKQPCSSNACTSGTPDPKQTCDFSMQTYYGNDFLTNGLTDKTSNGQKGLVFSISLENLRAPITKVVPVSRNDAWFISDKKLFKVTISGIEKCNSYTDDSDDITLMQTGQLLILNRNSSFIYQLNDDGSVTLFTSSDPYLPLCMDFIERENTLLLWMGDKDSRQMSQFGGNGEKKKSFSLPTSKRDCLFISTDSLNNFSIIYEVTQTTGVRNYVYSYVMEPRAYNTFAGRYGQSPYLQFICKGLCYDNEGNILASDMQFNTVYKLDGKLQFMKILLDKNSGLSSPTALAFKDGFLWVVDSTHLKVYDYVKLK